jgi:hypothetical protein
MILILETSQVCCKLLPWFKSVNPFMSHSLFKTTKMNTSRIGWTLRGKNPRYFHHQTLSSMEIQMVKCFVHLSICITYWDCSQSSGTNNKWVNLDNSGIKNKRYVAACKYDGGMPEMGLHAGTKG